MVKPPPLTPASLAGRFRSPPTPRSAYVMYTSGSTGRPKGTLIIHTGVVNYLTYMTKRFHFNSADRVVQFTSLAFDPSVLDILGTLTYGGTVFLLDDYADARSGFYSYRDPRPSSHPHCPCPDHAAGNLRLRPGGGTQANQPAINCVWRRGPARCGCQTCQAGIWGIGGTGQSLRADRMQYLGDRLCYPGLRSRTICRSFRLGNPSAIRASTSWTIISIRSRRVPKGSYLSEALGSGRAIGTGRT